MVQNQESRVSINWLFTLWKLGDAGVQVCPMAIPIPVDCSYVDKFNPFAAANHNDLSIQSHEKSPIPLDGEEFMQPSWHIDEFLIPFLPTWSNGPKPNLSPLSKKCSIRLQLHPWIHSPCAELISKLPENILGIDGWLQVQGQSWEPNKLGAWIPQNSSFSWCHEHTTSALNWMNCGDPWQAHWRSTESNRLLLCWFCSPKLVVENSAVCKV